MIVQCQACRCRFGSRELYDNHTCSVPHFQFEGKECNIVLHPKIGWEPFPSKTWIYPSRENAHLIIEHLKTFLNTPMSPKIIEEE